MKNVGNGRGYACVAFLLICCETTTALKKILFKKIYLHFLKLFLIANFSNIQRPINKNIIITCLMIIHIVLYLTYVYFTELL